ncbi:galactose oxidase early set domain-containing protein [Nostoc favosum]|uniref:DUF1929 domain-containing protein n=1 Tax=Nostoc favosum CHAB5714 TaxID=2780399 RepID=A0ABS8I6C8_9NOSO|nr:galactose oxidase early set domain-containing protein [Nostoc favosum]MCC5599755.1 DUF1929 domain-containing protein [Nostoc favosum CHAB5714]
MPWNSTVIDSQILAVHAALVPNGDEGEVVLFGGDEHWSAQQEPDGNFRKTRVYDVRSHSLVPVPIPSPDSDVFCAHHAFATDGRLLIAGGTQQWPESGDAHVHGLDFLGHRRCWLYNHKQRTWSEVTRLNTNPDQPDEPHSGGRWYPGLVTLANGEVAAFFGHLDQQDFRHRNTLPERYNQAGNFWVNMPKVMGTSGEPQSGGRRFLFFPRVYQIPNGQLFFATPMPANFSGSTEGDHFSTAYNPFTGNYQDPKIGLSDGAYFDWNRPAVLLPLLPTEDYRVRVLHVGGVTPRKLDLGAASPAWLPTAARVSSISGRDRTYSNAVLLPTGDVCVVGGVNVVKPEDPVLEAEIYSPGINWDIGSYSNADSWAVKQAGVHARNYHSTALLLPNGKVWVAGGNTNGDPGDPDSDRTVNGVTKKVGIKKIELYEPDYFAIPNRIQITDSPRVLTFDEPFVIEIDRPAANVKYVAMIRAGSVTHSTDNDQRFVALTINSRDGNTLNVSAPPNGNVAPPGYYMIWVVDNSNQPCQLAKFARLAYLGCTVITDRSTFSKEEVEALGGGGQATFNNAIYVQFDGFIHTELTGSPSFTVRWADTNAVVPDTDLTLIPAGRLQEVNPGFPDVPQRITFPFHIRFRNLNTYATFTDTRQLRVTFTLGHHTCSQTLDLTYAPNPYTIDINAAENNPAWLSTDVRVFSILEGQTKFGDIFQGTEPIQFIRQCLDRLNNPANNGNALFESLSTSATLDLATRFQVGPLGFPLFNYAIARVRYRATTTTAQRVKCFFRMFNVAATGLEFNPNTTYRRTAVGANTVPLIGTAGGEIVSIPFFASNRVETVQGRPGATSMTSQILDSTYEIRDIAPNPSGAEVTVYFGCWLDINQTQKRIPINPGGSDGPWAAASCRSIQELTRGRHTCIVSELFFEPDPTQNGETPGSSDNLSQRNLAILHSDNPGEPDSHTVMHTFEIKPSVEISTKAILQGNANPLVGDNLAVVGRQARLDELIFQWHNLPPSSEVTVYFSDIDTIEIQALSALRRSPLACEIVDKHTLKFKVAGATWIPIPGGRELNIPALLSIKLPDSVVYGEEYRVSIHQVAGRIGQIIGSCEFRIPVSKAELILDEEVRSLSVLKHIVTTIPTDNRWYPLMKRYVHHLGLKVDALGGDAKTVYPNPDGSGQPYDPSTQDDPCPEQKEVTDMVNSCCKPAIQWLWVMSALWLAVTLLLIVLILQK